MQKEIKAKHAMAALALLGLLGAVPGAQAVEWKDGETHNVGTGTTDENLSFQEQFTLSGGTVNFGSTNDKAGTITSSDKVTISGGTITVSGSGNKVSGAILMGGAANQNNPHTPQVKPGTTNTFIPDTDPTLVPPVHSITAANGMNISGVTINIGAPKYGAGGPEAGDITKKWEGLRFDFKTTGGNMAITGGDFRVANIAFPIKDEKNAALRFDSAGSLTVSGGQFTAQGQPVPNPARSNYDSPSLMSFKAKGNVVIDGGTFDIQTARVHMKSTDGKVIINDGTFNINSKSPYPGWKTFDKGTGGAPNTIYDEAHSTQTAKNVFGSLDTGGSLLEVNGGTFNIGTKGETTANYINMADKEAVFNGGTFNIYTNSSFGNNKAGTIIHGGTYNLIDGGYFGGRNTNGSSVNITGGTFNMEGGQGMFGYSIGVITEAAYLSDDKYNKATIDISGGTYNYNAKDNTKLEVSTVYAGYGVNISGGEFIRKQDGVNAMTAAFKVTGQTGSAAATSGDLNISGGTFRTAAKSTIMDGVVISRDDNVRLYNKNDSTIDPDTGAKVYKLHTEASVKALFAAGVAADIKEAFAPKNNADYMPTEAEVLKALAAANNMAVANTQLAWDFNAARNINITGGMFDLTTVNASSFKAGGTFNFANAKLISSGGGGALTISGKDGINLISGSIASYGGDENGPFALQYDNRNRLDRDRWTLGKYLNFKTDGDIIIGAKGTAGPDIYYQDGMLGFGTVTKDAPLGDLYLYSGTLTLNGEYRSTLNGGVMANSIIDGGTLRIRTADRINRNELDSASMWTLPVTLKSGLIDLYNAQLGGPVVMDGGVINAMGDSSINASSSTKVQLNAGIVNMGNKAYIGAIKGDSLKLSPYVTGTKDIELGDKLTVNMDVSKPASGNALTVGKDIGGIYASANNKGTATGGPTSITIADGTKFNITNPLALDAGTYTATSLVEAQNGTVTMKDRTFDSRFYGYTLNKASASSADMVLTVKNPVNAIAQLSGNSNIRDNAAGFSEILRNAKGNWLNVVDTVAHGSDGEAAEVLRQVGGENTTATTQSLVNSVGEYRTRMQSQGKSNISGLSGGDSMTVNGYRGWISAMGSWGSQADSDGRTGFDASSAGMALGFDTTFADRYTVGLGLGYAKGFSESKDSLSEANSDTWFVSLYTSLDFNPVVIDADVTYANTQSHINNTINAGGQRFENSGDFGIDSWSASIKGSYVFSFNDNATKIAPYVGIDFLSINQHGYSEEGPLAREFGSDQSTLWTLPVGIKASHQFRGQDWTFTPEIGVGYARDLNEFKPAAHVTIPGVSTTEIKSYGTEMSPDSFRGNAGFSVKYKDSVEFFGMYNLDARDKYTNHSVNVGFSYSF